MKFSFEGVASERMGDVPPPLISVISWVNDREKWNEVLLSCLAPIWMYQRGTVPVEFIVIDESDHCSRMGEAYELGRKRAQADIRCYLHQDMTVTDPSFYLKLLEIAKVRKIGALGFVGSTVDTGASWMHAPPDKCYGIHQTNRAEGNFDSPEFARVQLVDGFGFITMPSAKDIAWGRYPQYVGPHLAVEDMCMRVRQRGLEVWTVGASSVHESPGSADEGYWNSAEKFYLHWGHTMDSNAVPPQEIKAAIDRLRKRDLEPQLSSFVPAP